MAHGAQKCQRSVNKVSEDKKPSEEYSLKDSVKKVGMLVPIIKSKSGEIIDGNHRLEENPAWKDFSVTVNSIDTPVKEAIARLTINVCRRKVSREEKEFLVGLIARQTGWDAYQIADATGMSYEWVLKYFPEDLKDRAKVHPAPLIETESENPEVALQHNAKHEGAPQKEPAHLEMDERETCPNCGLSLDSSETVTIKAKEMKLCIDCAEEYRVTGTLSMMKLNEGEPQ